MYDNVCTSFRRFVLHMSKQHVSNDAFLTKRSLPTLGLILGVIGIGLIWGLTFGIGVASTLGLIIGPLSETVTREVIAIVVGLSAGLILGRSSGAFPLLIIQLGLIILTAIGGLGERQPVIEIWLFGILFGGWVGILSLTWHPAPQSMKRLTGNRVWAFWWWQRPIASEVEKALSAIQQAPWVTLLQDLDIITFST